MEVKKRIELFQKHYGYSPNAYEVCPKFESCSCNPCPLHYNFKKLVINDCDPEKKCKCPKRIRLEIGTFFKLENKGLKNREFKSMLSWDKLSEEQKQTKKQELLKNSQFARLKSKGYAITRIAKGEGDFTADKSLGSPENANLNAFSSQETQENTKETNNG